MPGSSLTRGLLGDALVGVVDQIRGKLRGALGTNPHRTAIVTRTWSGGRRGEGTPTEVVVELDPPPVFQDLAIRHVLRPGGREEEGDAILTGISLRYTEAELAPAARDDTEVAYRVTDAHGQEQKPRYFVPAAPPIARRGVRPSDATDWLITFRRVVDFGLDDG